MQNQTTLVRNAITIFLVVALCISMFQQVRRASQPKAQIKSPQGQNIGSDLPPNATPTQSTSQKSNVELNGTRVQGVVIRVTDQLHGAVKDMLIRNEYNVDIQSYEFQGGQWYLNLFLNYGHVLIVYFLMNKYQTETDDASKKKIMYFGIFVTVAWFLGTPYLKQQRLALQVNGRIEYQHNSLVQKDLLDRIAELDDINAFGRDDIEANKASKPSTKINDPILEEEMVIIEEDDF